MKILLPFILPAWLLWGAADPVGGRGTLVGQIILGLISAFIAHNQVQKIREDRLMREQDRKDRELRRRHEDEDRQRIADEMTRATRTAAAEVKETAKVEAAKVAVTASRLEKKVDVNTEATIVAAQIAAESAGNGHVEKVNRIKAAFDDLRIPPPQTLAAPPAAPGSEDARHPTPALRPDHRGDAGGGGGVLPGAP